VRFILKSVRKRVVAPGSRGGHYWIDHRGNVRYDEPPRAGASVEEMNEWVERQVALREQRSSMLREYDRVLPQLTTHHETLPPAERARVETMDFDFHDWVSGKNVNPQPLIEWARTVVPGAFRTKRAPRSVPAARAKVESVEPLNWLPPKLFHGTRDVAGVVAEGLRVHDAYHGLGDDPDVGWRDPYRRIRRDDPMIEWAPHVWRWYRSLSPEGKRKLKAQVGEFTTADELGHKVGLIWTLPYLSTVGRGNDRDDGRRGATLELDATKLSMFGAFEADELEGEIVLVVPPDVAVSDRSTVLRIVRDEARKPEAPRSILDLAPPQPAANQRPAANPPPAAPRAAREFRGQPVRDERAPLAPVEKRWPGWRIEPVLARIGSTWFQRWLVTEPSSGEGGLVGWRRDGKLKAWWIGGTTRDSLLADGNVVLDQDEPKPKPPKKSKDPKALVLIGPKGGKYTRTQKGGKHYEEKP